MVDLFPLFALWCVQDVVDHRVALPRMPDTDAQPPEIRCIEVRLNVFQPIVAAIAAALFDPDAARLQVKFVVNDKYFFGLNLEEPCQCSHGPPGLVHERHGLQQEHFTHPTDDGAEDAIYAKIEPDLLKFKESAAMQMPMYVGMGRGILAAGE